MSFTLEEIRAEAKKLLYKQEQDQEAERQRDTQKALQEALAKEERIRNERIRLLAEEEQVRELAKRLMIEAEAKTVAEAKEKAIKQELERLRNRTPIEILEDKVRDLQNSLVNVPKPKPIEDTLVQKLQERVNLLESFILDFTQADIYRSYPETKKTLLWRYKIDREIPSTRKFLIDVHLQSDERKEWSYGWARSDSGSQDPVIILSTDFTTNSFRLYRNTNQWPHMTICQVPFKLLGITNTTKKYSLILSFTEESVEITNEKGNGDSFQYPFNRDHGFPENMFALGTQWRLPDTTIRELYQ